MVEVLAKTEKYINGEEALLSKKKSSSTQKEKSKGDKKWEQSPKRQADRDCEAPKPGCPLTAHQPAKNS